MRYKFIVMIAAMLIGTTALPQTKELAANKIAIWQKASLARALCNSKQRQAAIHRVVSNPTPVLPSLLAWTKCPLVIGWEKCPEGPPAVNGVDPWCLYYAMAEIFGRLRTKEAIPYLVDNIWLGYNPRRASEAELDSQSPAIRALIQIGPEATPALLEALRKWPARATSHPYRQNHLGILIALSNMDDPRARTALEQAAKEPGPEGKVAAEGLQRLEKKK